MLFPDISAYPDVQKEAIKEAKDIGQSSFSLENTIYSLYRDKNAFRIDAHRDSEIGSIFTDWRGGHYAFKVNNHFRGQGVGKVLFTTKQALDGVLRQEWSGVYSRMFFLMQFGYMPLSRISKVRDTNGDRPLGREENRVLLDDLCFYAKNKHKLSDWFGTCPFLVRMLYAPRGAQALLERVKTQS